MDQPQRSDPLLHRRRAHSGGSYGSKQLIPHLALQAIALARETGRAVKLMMDRTDHMLSYELRQGSRIRGKVGITQDGIINSIQGMWYIDSGMSSTYAQAMPARHSAANVRTGTWIPC